MQVFNLYTIAHPNCEKEKIIPLLERLRNVLNDFNKNRYYQGTVNDAITDFIQILQDVNDEEGQQEIARYFPSFLSLNWEFFFQSWVSTIIYPLLVNCALTSFQEDEDIEFTSIRFSLLKIFFKEHLSSLLKVLIDSNKKSEDKLEDLHTTGAFLAKCAQQLLKEKVFSESPIIVQTAILFAETAKNFLEIHLPMPNVTFVPLGRVLGANNDLDLPFYALINGYIQLGERGKVEKNAEEEVDASSAISASSFPARVLRADSVLLFYVLINGYIQLGAKDAVKKNVEEVFNVTSAILSGEEIEFSLMEMPLWDAAGNLMDKHYYEEALTLLSQHENMCRGNFNKNNPLAGWDEEYYKIRLATTFMKKAYSYLKLQNLVEAEKCLDEIHVLFLFEFSHPEVELIDCALKEFQEMNKEISEFTKTILPSTINNNNSNIELFSSKLLQIDKMIVIKIADFKTKNEDGFIYESENSDVGGEEIPAAQSLGTPPSFFKQVENDTSKGERNENNSMEYNIEEEKEIYDGMEEESYIMDETHDAPQPYK